MPTIVIYHDKCTDGFTGAWVIKRAIPDAVFFPATHQEPPPNVEGMDVVIVDFSYKQEIIEMMLKHCNSMLIIDHHVTSEKELKNFIHPKLKTYFDTSHSGAVLAWMHYFPTEPVPIMVQYVEDRDIWINKMEYTKEISAAIFSFEKSFELWDIVMFGDPLIYVYEGQAILRKVEKDVKDLISITKRSMRIGGYMVPVANIPYIMTSEAGNIMSKGQPFAACYWDTPEGRVFSLRSQKNGLDVSLIAESYGGGGHQNSSGFRIPSNKLLELELF
jgi:oligoribonuclease NrnB/cAMP/cGMP phosphodiesterase (DHH superfamily)